MRAYERFLRYIQFDTASSEASETCPSTPGQLVLGRALVKEMLEMGISDARMDEYGYVYGSIPATAPARPAIGLIAHMDTVDCVPALPMNARIVENYDGGAVRLESGDLLDPAEFPELKRRAGKDLIVTDGKTLLGADDKAGVAEILSACERLLNCDVPHGRVCIGFTPDEEIGRGASHFDVPGFGADYAYTVDGDELGSVEYENFNAASASLTFHGKSVHPGSAKDKLVNAALIAMEFNSMLPPRERPEHTEGYEGFYYLCEISGGTELARSDYILRDHDRAHFEARKQTIARIADALNEKYGPGTVDCAIRDSYFNMREVIEPHMHIVRRAEAAYRAVGIAPYAKPIRGGTDGAHLSFEGLPCPNLATGGMNYHGRFECIAVQDMDVMTDVLFHLLTLPPEVDAP